ncbi:hypothetical protein HY312_01950 [Candidatus Saccharibacteria bacterium]|nr:hypothetical protein [Candidatus Saccharibacteria bacterium]
MMNPELNDDRDKDMSKQLPPTPTTEARPEDVYTEPETVEAPEPQNDEPATPMITPSQEPKGQDQDSGKTLAIIGIVFAILPLQLIGLILSIIAKIKAKKGSSVNTIAVVGIVLNIVFGLISIGIFSAIVLTAFNGINELTQEQSQVAEQRETSAIRNKTATAQMAVISAQKIAEAHNALEGAYPKTTDELQGVTPIEIVSTKAMTEEPTNPSIVEYAICDEGASFRIGYWNYNEQRVAYDTEEDSAGSEDADTCIVVAQLTATKDAAEAAEPRSGALPL